MHVDLRKACTYVGLAGLLTVAGCSSVSDGLPVPSNVGTSQSGPPQPSEPPDSSEPSEPSEPTTAEDVARAAFDALGSRSAAALKELLCVKHTPRTEDLLARADSMVSARLDRIRPMSDFFAVEGTASDQAGLISHLIGVVRSEDGRWCVSGLEIESSSTPSTPASLQPRSKAIEVLRKFLAEVDRDDRDGYSPDAT